jgi:hypothetical protein
MAAHGKERETVRECSGDDDDAQLGFYRCGLGRLPTWLGSGSGSVDRRNGLCDIYGGSLQIRIMWIDGDDGQFGSKSEMGLSSELAGEHGDGGYKVKPVIRSDGGVWVWQIVVNGHG